MGVQRVQLEGMRTWTVTGGDHLPVGPVEEFLDHLRVAQGSSPNTVRSYATSLDRWWVYLSAAGLAWDEVTLASFTPYLASLRTGQPPGCGCRRVSSRLAWARRRWRSGSPLCCRFTGITVTCTAFRLRGGCTGRVAGPGGTCRRWLICGTGRGRVPPSGSGGRRSGPCRS